jgi:hypothetical protein
VLRTHDWFAAGSSLLLLLLLLLVVHVIRQYDGGEGTLRSSILLIGGWLKLGEQGK